MVGTIIFKNFETGSYGEMILTCYGGKNYADIGKGDFFSCRVSLENKAIYYEYMSCEDIEFRDMFDIFAVAHKAREYLTKNTHVTIAEFCFDTMDCVFRPKSFTCGVCEPVDFRTLFNNGGFYMLVKSFKEKSPLWLSVFCEVINYCVQKSFDVSVDVFGYSGYGVYLNISAFEKRVLSEVPEKFRSLADAKDCFCVRKLSPNTDFGEKPTPVLKTETERILHGFSLLKLKSAKHFGEEIIPVFNKKDVFGMVKSLAKSTFVESLCDEFVSSLLEFAAFCFHYGYVEGASHVKMLTFKEIMLLNAGILRREDVAVSATARSVNRKYINSLPCVPYIDSDGTAYWE